MKRVVRKFYCTAFDEWVKIESDEMYQLGQSQPVSYRPLNCLSQRDDCGAHGCGGISSTQGIPWQIDQAKGSRPVF